MDFTSEEKIDKLQKEITDARSPKHKCSLLIDMAMELRYSNPAASLREAQKALAISEEINFDLGKARSYFCMGFAHFNLSDYENAFVFLDHAYHRYLEAGDMVALGRVTALLNTQEIKSLNAMMEEQEKERKRIAADLHDRIGSSLCHQAAFDWLCQIRRCTLTNGK